MKKDWKYIAYIAIILGIFILVQLTRSQQFDWRVTYASFDKNPYGTIALQRLLRNSGYAVKNSYKTLYELKDSISTKDALFIAATTFNTGKEEIDVLLKHVATGGEALVMADYFYGSLPDTLGIAVRDNLFKGPELFNKEDTSTLHFTNPSIDTLINFPYRRDHIHTYFGKIDSVKASVLIKNENGRPVMVKIKHGMGNLFLFCSPMVITNIHLLSKQNSELVASVFSCLNSTRIIRTEYYHLGRMEISSPLRFVLSNETLRWAYYTAIITLFLFMIFEAKRKQRIIPILQPLANTTLEFVSTIGNLYYQRADHKNMAEKKIVFFWDRVRSHYYIQIPPDRSSFAEVLAKKTRHAVDDVKNLLRQFDTIHASLKIDARQLKEVSDSITKFWKKNSSIKF